MTDKELRTIILMMLLLIFIIIAVTSYLLGFMTCQTQCYTELRIKDFKLVNETHYLNYLGNSSWTTKGI